MTKWAGETRGVIAYEITNIDYFEQDALLNLGGIKMYFQFSEEEGPTLTEALKYIYKEQHSV